MTGRERAAVEAHLRRLGSDELAAFVADLWRRRGYETAREDGVVVATRDGHTLRIAPVVPSRLRPWTASLPDDVDVVVAPRGTGWADVPGEVRVLDAADLRELLWYALDAHNRKHLCGDHLGAAPKYLALPRTARIAERLGSGSTATPPRGSRTESRATGLDGVADTASRSISVVGSLSTGGSLRTAAGAVAVTVVFALLVVSAATGALFVGSPASGPDAASVTTETPAALPSDTGTPIETLTEPSAPGLSRAGVTNLTALAAAHAAALANRSYAVWLDRYRRPADNGARSQRDVDVTVEGDRYLVRVGMGDDNDRRIVREVYYDGREWFVANRSDRTTTRYARVAGDRTAPLTVPDPFELRRSLVETYLSTPTTNVTGTVEEGGRVFYRVTGEGVPTGGGFENASDYSVTALVDRRGLVHDLTVEYRDDTLPGSPEVRFEATYGEFGRATVTAPAWHDRYFENATATVVTANATRTPRPAGGESVP